MKRKLRLDSEASYLMAAIMGGSNPPKTVGELRKCLEKYEEGKRKLIEQIKRGAK